MKKKKNLNTLLRNIDIKKRKICRQIWKDNYAGFENYPGSTTKHQAWIGGYKDHTEEVMNIAILIFKILDSKRKLQFKLSDLLFVAFLHDFDKLIRYDRSKSKSSMYRSKDYPALIKQILKDKYGYKLTQNELNAIKYAHGEGSDYHPTDRVMMPMSTILHCCDSISSRVWFDEGRDSDNW